MGTTTMPTEDAQMIGEQLERYRAWARALELAGRFEGVSAE